VTPEKQVQGLLDGIDCLNMTIAAALATLLATSNHCENFQVVSGNLCNFVMANKSENTSRNITIIGCGSQGGTARGHSGGCSSG
jgi:hypothetical protein